MAPVCLYALLTTSGHAPDEWCPGISYKTWIRPSVSSWTVCGGGTPKAYRTRVRSDNPPDDFIPVPNNNQGTVNHDMQVRATVPGLTGQLVMVDEVTDSIKFSTASPDCFTPVPRVQCEPALIGEEHGELCFLFVTCM
ncbi:unnamed protein product [Pleuronectes platessa]|uniref:Uncharacterized protein n=1 Tax=Pleuronectes platessa TaxID=8262 RepID=A0A9N7VR52_PLEPL|nr:unnamed protein product [Pleuronectes platessa]